jgi:anti-sigma regulatory factor (Ser/Thr protein kinase)
MIGGSVHQAIDVGDPSCVGEVRRAATRLAHTLGFDDVATGRVAIVANELANNLVRHASGGRVLLAALGPAGPGARVQFLSLDRGPGIADVAGSLADGYSTAGTPGTGLGAVRRMSMRFDLFSLRSVGTVVLAQVGPGLPDSTRTDASDAVELAAIRLCAPGEMVCGDNWSARRKDGRVTVLMADGLGHGPQAQQAADEAVALFEQHVDEAPAVLLDRLHGGLRGTRGAAVALIEADGDAVPGTLRFGGLGNIAGRVISGISDRSLMSQHGTAGVQARRAQEVAYEWPAHAVVVLHSDGFLTRWTLNEARGVLRHHPAVIAGWIARENIRGRDDATIVVFRRREG